MPFFEIPGGGLSSRHPNDNQTAADVAADAALAALSALIDAQTVEDSAANSDAASSLVKVTSSEPSRAPAERPMDATVVTGLPSLTVETLAEAEMTPAVGPPSDGVISGYADFPIAHVRDLQEFDDPLQAMNDLRRQLLVHQDYGRVRTEYCHLAIRLNLIGKFAPGYRPNLSTGAAFGKAIHNVLHRDEVVIDLHWCHATKMPLMPLESGHVALFGDNADFPFDLAWMLAGKKWTDNFRAAEALCLTTFQQCQMLTLRGPEIDARLKSLSAGWRVSGGKWVSKIATVKRAISQWAEQDKRIVLQRDSYEKLWLARELLGPGAATQQIAELHALMTGSEVRDRGTIRDKLKSLDAHVPVV